MLWAVLTLAGSAAGAAIAAAGLLVRPTRWALPLHALGMAVAFLAGGAFLRILSERIERGFFWTEAIREAGLILAVFILPFCVIASLFITAAMKWPRFTLAASALTFVAAFTLLGSGDATGLLVTGIVSGLLVAPTVLAHRGIRSMTDAFAWRRLVAVVGWTLANALLVVALAEHFLLSILND